jgi:hypothetical protein
MKHPANDHIHPSFQSPVAPMEVVIGKEVHFLKEIDWQQWL